MPKPFPILIEVEEIALGPVLRKLNGMPGISALHFDLNARSRGPYKKNGKAPHGTKGVHPLNKRLAYLALLKDGKPHSNREILAAHPDIDGKSLHNTTANAERSKLIHRVKPGTFQLTAKGQAFITANAKG